MYYKNGFYEEMVTGAVEITDEVYEALKIGNSQGKEIVPGPNGFPVLQDKAEEIVVPPSVTMYQARVALLNAGLLDDVEAILAAMPDGIDRRRAHLAWEFASTVERTSSVLAMLAAALGLSDTQLDALFIAASQVQ